MPGYDANTKLLIHLDGADGATSYTAETGQTLSFNGTAQLDTAEKKFGDSSLLLDGDSDYFTIPSDTALNIFDGSNWTVDLWVKHYDSSKSHDWISHYADGDNYWVFYFNSGQNISLFSKLAGSSYSCTSSSIFDLSTQFNHIAWIRVGSDEGIYLNGTQVAYTSGGITGTLPTTAINFCRWATGAEYFKGHMDEIRFQKSNYFNAAPNVGLTNTITVPTAAYAAYVAPRCRSFRGSIIM